MSMTGACAFLLTFSSLLCAAPGGIYAFGCCALLCLFLAFSVPLLPKKLPRWLGFLPAFSLFLRLVPLLPALLPELGNARTPAFLGLVLAAVVCLSISHTELLPRAALPLAFLAVGCSVICLSGSFSPVFAPAQTLDGRLFPLCAALLCPLSGALLLPSVGRIEGEKPPTCPRLRTLLLAVLAATVCVLPALLFEQRFWMGGALLFACPLCSAAELRVLIGKHA